MPLFSSLFNGNSNGTPHEHTVLSWQPSAKALGPDLAGGNPHRSVCSCCHYYYQTLSLTWYQRYTSCASCTGCVAALFCRSHRIISVVNPSTLVWPWGQVRARWKVLWVACAWLSNLEKCFCSLPSPGRVPSEGPRSARSSRPESLGKRQPLGSLIALNPDSLCSFNSWLVSSVCVVFLLSCFLGNLYFVEKKKKNV